MKMKYLYKKLVMLRRKFRGKIFYGILIIIMLLVKYYPSNISWNGFQAKYAHKFVEDYHTEKGDLSFLKNCSFDLNYNEKVHQIPKLVHLIWFSDGKLRFEFHHFVSMLSIVKYLSDFQIVFWNNNHPNGKWWQITLSNIPKLCSKYLTPPTTIFGNNIKEPAHQSDVARIEILMKHGGIYIDYDTIIVNSLNKLLKHSIVLGSETPNKLGNAFIISRPNATFLRLWYKSYHNFNDNEWATHSGIMPMKIAKAKPNLVYIEWFLIYHPNYHDIKWLYKEGYLYEWHNNYIVHLYNRLSNSKLDLQYAKSANTTVAEVLRYIAFGDERLIT